MEIGETIAETVVREVQEETGLEVDPERLVGISTNPHHVTAYDDGEVRQQFSICFACRIIGGQLLDHADESLAQVPQLKPVLATYPGKTAGQAHGAW